MNAKAWRLYGANDIRLEDVKLEGAGHDGIVVELVSNTICMSDYKCVSLGAAHKRVPHDIAEHPVMFGHEIAGVIREVGEKWRGQFSVGQRVGLQPALNIPGHELEAIGYAWRAIGGETTHVRLPSCVMERGCLLPYEGDAYFKCSLAEPISCIISGLRTNFHNAFCSHRLENGIVDKGTMLIMAGCGAMGLGFVDVACHSPEKRPRRLVVTDVDAIRLAHAARIFGLRLKGNCADGEINGVEVHLVNVKDMVDPIGALKALNTDDVRMNNPTATGGGYDDIFLLAAVPSLITQSSSLLAFGGCLNFFAGPVQPHLLAEFDFSNVHYMMHHVVANSGGTVEDMQDAVSWISKGILHPEVMVTHVGGLDSAADSTLNLPKNVGGKRVVYTHFEMPMTAIEDFGKLGSTNSLYAGLAGICEANNGLWSKEAEDYLLANAPRIAIGENGIHVSERTVG